MQKISIDKKYETTAIFKKLNSAHRALAELKGISSSLPDANMLINTLAIQEAKDSSEIENIITTYDEFYKKSLLPNDMSPNEKEVRNYVSALKKGFEIVSNNEFITNNHIIEIQSVLEQNDAGFRRVPGTVLKNKSSGATIYTPPQEYDEIVELMRDLEGFINDDSISDLDELVKMAIIHYQFESIHPFYDGNGRTGRILNILYLVNKGLLEYPVLYMSRYILEFKSEYYRLLRDIRTKDNWEEWILYLLNVVEETAKGTMRLIRNVLDLMSEYDVFLKRDYKFYSTQLLNNLFLHPYTKIEFIQRDLGVSRITAANYLNRLSADGILTKQKLGNMNFYTNIKLFDLLSNVNTKV